MSKQAIVILVGLVILTLGGLFLVSNFITEETPNEIARHSQELMASESAPAVSPSLRPVSSAEAVASDLQKAQEQLNQINLAIRNGEWTKAENYFIAFEQKNRRLPAPQLKHPEITPILQDFFDYSVVQLERAIEEKQSRAAKIAANQLLGIIEESQARFNDPPVPVEIARLHYLIRELSLWNELSDDRMVRSRMSALSEAWNDASPIIRQHEKGEVLAKRFDELLAQSLSVSGPSKLTPMISEFNDYLTEIDAILNSAAR